ncbi:MAG TPA: hypothetical protein VER17_03005 [Tepidisphaeraceae bacterium]|nr:hypothetical protein [Tepidisphaeraceae bacterium]
MSSGSANSAVRADKRCGDAGVVNIVGATASGAMCSLWLMRVAALYPAGRAARDGGIVGPRSFDGHAQAAAAAAARSAETPLAPRARSATMRRHANQRGVMMAKKKMRSMVSATDRRKTQNSTGENSKKTRNDVASTRATKAATGQRQGGQNAGAKKQK